MDSSIARVSEVISPKAAGWASAVAAAYARQLQSRGSLDPLALRQELEPESESLSGFICSQLKEDKTLTDERNVDRVETDISRLVEEAAARALASDPQLLLKIGLTTTGSLPQFVLKNPAPSAETPIDNPAAFASVVKPEFLDAKGGLKLPAPKDTTYPDFQAWLYEPSLDNKLLEQSSFAGQPVRADISACLTK